MITIDTHDHQALSLKASALHDQVFRGVPLPDNVRTVASEVSDSDIRLQEPPLTRLCRLPGARLFQQSVNHFLNVGCSTDITHQSHRANLLMDVFASSSATSLATALI